MYEVIKINLLTPLKLQLRESINPGGGYNKYRLHILIIADLWTDNCS